MGHLQDSLGLEGLDEGGAEGELKAALEVLVLGGGDLGALLRALEAEFAFVVALVEVAEAGLLVGSLEGLPDAVLGGDLGAVDQGGELRVGAQVGGDLLGAGFVDVVGVGLERGVGGLKLRLHLVPGERLLGVGERANGK